ncbi:MAG: DUF3299 domain-containing protein [Burkholderiales bacterium]|nr:DUF3299 domain-containing protein [Burkholderiales bacterium]
MQAGSLPFLSLGNFRKWALAAATAIFCVILGNPSSADNPPGKIPDEQLFGFIGKDPLPPGTIPWQLLRQVKLVEGKQKGAKTPSMLPEFGPELKALDKKDVKIYGFVLPLSTSQKQSHFLISPLPSHCPFCVDQGPDSMIEVVAKNPVAYSPWEPIVISGKFELVNDQYLFYRLTGGEAVKN